MFPVFIVVVLISIFGTLLTDNLTDNMGWLLEKNNHSLPLFKYALKRFSRLGLWYVKEKNTFNP